MAAPQSNLSCDEWMARLGIDLFDEEARDRVEMLFWDLAQDLQQSHPVTVAATVDETPPND